METLETETETNTDLNGAGMKLATIPYSAKRVALITTF
jgi:hypothetical protein